MSSPNTTRVRHVSDLVTKGTTPTTIGRRYTNKGVRFLKVETFDSSGNYLPGREAFIDAATHQLLRRSQLSEGDILFSIAGALGRSTIVHHDWLPANTNQAFAIIRPSARRRAIYPRYLLWQLRSPAMAKHIGEINVRAAQANLSLEQVRDFEIPLISEQEQTAVAGALDDVEGLIDALERQTAKKQAIKQGTMQQLLTGRTRLPSFSDPWRSTTLGAVVKVVGGGTPPRSVSAYWGGRIPWATVKDISNFNPRGTQEYITPAALQASSARLVPAGTPVLAARMLVGKAVRFDVDVAINQDLKALVGAADDVDASYLCHWFDAYGAALAASAGGSTVAGTSTGEIKTMPIGLPRLDEQQAIAAVLDDADAALRALRNRLTKARAIKTGMMQQLLTGRTRLPVEAAS